MKTGTWVRLAAIGVTAVVGLSAGYVLLRYFTGILLPFLLAALVASLLRPAALFFQRRLRLPEKLGGTLLIAAAVSLLSFGIVGAGRFFYGEVREGIAALPAMLEDSANPLRKLVDLLERWNGDDPAAAGEAEALYGMVSGMVQNAVTAASEALTNGAAAVIVKLPRVILSLLVGIVALFYLFFDHEKLRQQLRLFFGDRAVGKMSAFLSRTRAALGDYLRAYLSLTLLTYSGLLAGFLLLNVDRPAVIAAVVALVDLLPVFGVGTVLVPWGVFCLAAGDVYRGVGLLILFAVLYVVRQFAEPRLIGSTLGVHPLFSLFAVYAGFSLFGIFGVFLAPVLLYGAKALLRSFREERETETNA